jgi:hypothetical protein
MRKMLALKEPKSKAFFFLMYFFQIIMVFFSVNVGLIKTEDYFNLLS